MQIFRVLLGCFCSYVAGVFYFVVFSVADRYMGTGEITFDKLEVALFAYVGFVVGALYTFIVVIIWAALAWKNKRVSWKTAILIAIAVFAFPLMIWVPSLISLLFSIIFGSFIGVIFWLTAFGRVREAKMRFR
ncbi:MAG: hypothetical protein AAGI92_12665 [Pseudomonadota bacterium]